MKTQKFSYQFTPAGITSNFVPLIVILYADVGMHLEDFEYKMWNVLQICSYGIDEGSLEELIVEFSETYECEDYVFAYGDVKSIKKTISKGVIVESNTIYASASELSQRDKLKKVLDEFEKMVPDL
ncbi:hypothetical protein JHD46_03080 [Sulfurimonas sp. SAG-AH-194-C20]|nr:hypothetical protein [Sulfurimonas sp. SAG-AH-194-C20]MDF1878618.1 hypothetical protein [Sulfurimonas sp. SAG-AH-194-C20]